MQITKGDMPISTTELVEIHFLIPLPAHNTSLENLTYELVIQTYSMTMVMNK